MGAFSSMGGTLATLRGVPKYLTLRVRGTILGQRVLVLVDSGATHSFIDTQLVQRRGIHIADFEGFSVLVLGARTMQCAKYVPTLTITLETYTLTYHFFIFDILDAKLILGVQWLITLGKVTTYWETFEMEWTNKGSGKHQKIKVIHTYPP